jgi:hypothetical protein
MTIRLRSSCVTAGLDRSLWSRTSPSSPASVIGGDELPVLAARQPGAQLLQQARLVGHEPRLGDAARREAKDPDFVDIDLAAGRRDAEKISLLGAGDLEEHAHPVAIGDHFLDRIHPVGESRAQKRARSGEALPGGVVAEILHAGAQAPVVRREDFAHDLGLLFRPLRFLEAAHDGLVACQRGRRRFRSRRAAWNQRAGAERCNSGEHAAPCRRGPIYNAAGRLLPVLFLHGTPFISDPKKIH